MKGSEYLKLLAEYATAHFVQDFPSERIPTKKPHRDGGFLSTMCGVCCQTREAHGEGADHEWRAPM